MTLESRLQRRGSVAFPAFTGERAYMVPFFKRRGLPPSLSRWQPTVDAMLNGIDSDLPIYLMIDQAVVTPGKPHRRPGVHIDGYWNGFSASHGDAPPFHGSTPSRTGHSGYPSTHGSQPLPRGHSSRGHGSHTSSAGGWSPDATYDEKEGLILASDVAGCRAYVGPFDGAPGEGGDCSHIDLSSLDVVDCELGAVYAGNVTLLHESVPIPAGGLRTLVRLNVRGWSP